jgi:hypothetical protein
MRALSSSQQVLREEVTRYNDRVKKFTADNGILSAFKRAHTHSKKVSMWPRVRFALHIICTAQSFRSMEDPQLDMFFGDLGLSRASAVGTRRYMAQTLIPSLYGFIQYVKFAEGQSHTVNAISLSADGWTSSTKQHFVGINVHYVDANFRPHSQLLSLVPSDVSQTAECIRNILRKEIDAIFPGDILVHALTVDNGSNYQAAASAYASDDGKVSCCVHTLQLVVRDALVTVQADMQSVASIAKAFRNTSNLRAALKTQLGNSEGLHIFPVPNDTRWNGQFSMLKCFTDLYAHLLFMKTTQILNPDTCDPEILDLICDAFFNKCSAYVSLLTPFYFATKIWQSDTEFVAADVPAWVAAQLALLRSSNIPSVGVKLATSLEQNLASRFEALLTEVNPLLLAASLTPAHSKLEFVDAKTQEAITTALVDNLLLLNHEDDSQRSAITMIINGVRERLRISSEQKPEPKTSEFWLRQTTFAGVAGLARMALSVQASSASSERTFSLAGFIEGCRRSRLGPNLLKMQTIIASYVRSVDSTSFIQRFLETTGLDGEHTADAKFNAFLYSLIDINANQEDDSAASEED